VAHALRACVRGLQRIKHEEQWQAALAKATGRRLEDDPAKLKRLLKRKQKQKQKSSTEWCAWPGWGSLAGVFHLMEGGAGPSD
jgi:hypothetical protein